MEKRVKPEKVGKIDLLNYDEILRKLRREFQIDKILFSNCQLINLPPILCLLFNTDKKGKGRNI